MAGATGPVPEVPPGGPPRDRPHPLRLDGEPPSGLSRWWWLVKWLLLLPHAVVLGFLWVGYLLVWPVVLVAVLATGRYPRAIFDYQVGVLRWTWRVEYYGYGALATDLYPAFTLQDDPAYPARLAVEYPERLSRGLALVKWWLLALPHYLVVALLVGWEVRWGDEDFLVEHGTQVGLIGVLVLVAALVLLVTGRYPRGLLDLVVGLNRWVYRVVVYASLMTDRYPPFRLDQGPAEPADGGG